MGETCATCTHFKREDGYKEGILAAKSILHNFYKWKGGAEE